MDSRKNLVLAQNLSIQSYTQLIREVLLHKESPVLKVVFNFEFTLYIRYNDFGEYSITIIFSPKPDDQIRFDNHDDRWDVQTRPHHFYDRGLQYSCESLTLGDTHFTSYC